MGKEIERKFLLKDDSWRSLAKGEKYRQGYLNSVKERIVRVRTIDDKGFLTIKGMVTGATRSEFEYDIPAAEAAVIKYLCRWRYKNGLEDLRKAARYLEMLIELEENPEKYKEHNSICL